MKLFMDLVPVFSMAASHSNFNGLSVITAGWLINSGSFVNSAFEVK